MKSVFNKADVTELIARINTLNPNSKAQWGKMTVDQMLAHCNVTYEMTYENMHPKPNFMMRTVLKLLVKNKVVGEKPYPKNTPTAPQFIITGNRDFEKEKQRLIGYINRTEQLGEAHFEGKDSHSFGALTAGEWNRMFYKHLDHHLTQFGA